MGVWVCVCECVYVGSNRSVCVCLVSTEIAILLT